MTVDLLVFRGSHNNKRNLIMQLSKQLSASSTAIDFIDMQRYSSHQPCVLNLYFGINLITAVDKLPPRTQKQKLTETNLLQYKTQHKDYDSVQTELQHKTLVYHHEVNRLSQDIQINQYAIANQLLGRGAHSIVKLCKADNKHYAVKILWLDKIKKKYFLRQKQIVKMINSEISFLLRLKHPNIIGFTQAIYSQEKERMFIVLQHCPRGSLTALIASNLTTDDQKWQRLVRGYFKQTVQGLSFMHEQGIIHRDIKPDNLLISINDQVKIIDFNISQVVREDNNIIVSSKFIGTRGYAAPELLLDVEEEKVVNGKNIDVWALGITLWEMLEKKHPFNVKTLEDLQKHLSREMTFSENYPADLRDLLARMLKHNNQERASIKQIKNHAWLRKT